MIDREKSVLYPGVAWSECMEFIKIVNNFDLKSVAYLEVAKKYGLKNHSTRSFTTRISASKQFGLITTNNSTIQLTDSALKILYPTNKNIRDVELECIRNPPLYERLINEYNEKALPDISILSNVLMNNYKITRNAKDIVAKVFLETCEQLDLIQGGVLCYKQEKTNIHETTEYESEEILSDFQTNSRPHIADQNEEDINEYITQIYPVESGKAAKIVIPIDSTEDDLWAIRDMLDIIMKRKFKINL